MWAGWPSHFGETWIVLPDDMRVLEVPSQEVKRLEVAMGLPRQPTVTRPGPGDPS
jgi:hypothetical protein